ncbi:MAG: hypothetical protein PHU45_02735 [Bacilli bacterium]|nr:hypothetical protein [Bacilli bacterium]
MVNVKKFISAKYLTAKVAGDLKGKKLVIDSAFMEQIKDSDKLCLRFKNVDLPMPLNQTNLTVLTAAWGEESNDWINKSVILNIVNVSFQGEVAKGIQLEPVN